MAFSFILYLLVTLFSIPFFDLGTYFFISIIFLKINPLAKESGKVGTYVTLKQYSKTNRLVGALEISFDELFGLTSDSTLRYEKEVLLKQLKEREKRIKELEDKIQSS